MAQDENQQKRVAQHIPDSLPGALTHVRQLDGIRGTAILLVLVFHFYIFEGIKDYLNSTPLKALWGMAGSGWLGVDLFFVLSGFLITSILLNTKESSSYFKSFYGRRILRIFPLYFLCLFLYYHVPLSIFRQVPMEVFHYPGAPVRPGHQIWFWTYLANWRTGIWPSDELSHFWSLCVEEQFYFVWPLVVWITSKRTFPWVCLGTIAAFIGAGVAFEFAGLPEGFVMMSSVPRAQAIVFGALLAWLVRQSWLTRVTSQLKLILPAAMGGVLICALNPPYFPPYHTIELLIAGVAWSALLLHCVTCSHGVIARIMINPVLCSLGKYSYAMYVLNQYVYFWVGNYVANTLKSHISSAPVLLALIFISMIGGVYLAGVLSWFLFEKHFLRLKKYFSYQRNSPVAAKPELALAATEVND